MLSFLSIINKICLFKLQIARPNSIRTIQTWIHFIFLSGWITLANTTSTIHPLTHTQECCSSHSCNVPTCPEICFCKDTLTQEWDTWVWVSWHKTNMPPPLNRLPFGTLNELSVRMSVSKIWSHSSFTGTEHCFSLLVCGNSVLLSDYKMRFLASEGEKAFCNLIPRVHKHLIMIQNLSLQSICPCAISLHLC